MTFPRHRGVDHQVDPRPPIFQTEEDPAQHLRTPGPNDVVVLGGGGHENHDLVPDLSPRRRSVTFLLQSPDAKGPPPLVHPDAKGPPLVHPPLVHQGGASSTAKKSCTTTERAFPLPRAPAPSPDRNWNKPWKREGIKKELDTERRRITRIKEERPTKTSSGAEERPKKTSGVGPALSSSRTSTTGLSIPEQLALRWQQGRGNHAAASGVAYRIGKVLPPHIGKRIRLQMCDADL